MGTAARAIATAVLVASILVLAGLFLTGVSATVKGDPQAQGRACGSAFSVLREQTGYHGGEEPADLEAFNQNCIDNARRRVAVGGGMLVPVALASLVLVRTRPQPRRNTHKTTSNA
jgi:hypothetical protein